MFNSLRNLAESLTGFALPLLDDVGGHVGDWEQFDSLPVDGADTRGGSDLLAVGDGRLGGGAIDRGGWAWPPRGDAIDRADLSWLPVDGDGPATGDADGDLKRPMTDADSRITGSWVTCEEVCDPVANEDLSGNRD